MTYVEKIDVARLLSIKSNQTTLKQSQLSRLSEHLTVKLLINTSKGVFFIGRDTSKHSF